MAKKQLAIEYVPTADLAADPANLRKHSEKNLKAVEGSIKRFGFQTPIVVDADNIIVAGHARYEVLKSLGHEKIPVIRTELTGADRVAYAIADNRTSELAEWDDAALADVLKELENIGDIGFDDADLKAIVAGLDQGEVVEDEVPPPPKEPRTKPGDVWKLGEHRVLCGDATITESPPGMFCCITDPPYSVDYGESHKSKERGGNKEVFNSYKETGDPNDVLGFVDMLRCDRLVMSYPWDRHFFAIADALKRNKMEVFKLLVWVKSVQSFWIHARYQQKHESIMLLHRKGTPMLCTPPPDQTTVFMVDKPHAHKDHPTQKPMELWAKLVEYHAPPGEWVFDPFLGSGTTLIAAEQLGRKCYGIEISPAYVDVCVARWEALTGEKATR